MSAQVKTISASQFQQLYRDASDKLCIVDLRTLSSLFIFSVLVARARRSRQKN